MKFSRYNKKKRNITKYIIFLLITLLVLYSMFIGLQYSTKEFFKKNIYIFFDYLSENYDYKLQNVELNTLNYIDKSEIITFFESYYNNSIFLIPVEKILKKIEKEKWIKDIKIKSNYKDTLTITILEHNPKGILKKDGKFYVFNNKGEIIDIINPNNRIFSDLIIFRGEKALDYSNPFLSSVPLFLVKEISEVIYINDRRWDVLLKNGIKLKLKEDDVQNSFMHYAI